ncbi:MAG TPA: HAMP domain-containing sensor histidine kinase [Gemmataceae bacterium]|nr:HAMP domain-containing sensor histidine kinase [Gemmataceae bacterium]
MSFDQLRTFFSTLRFRLTLWNTALVLVLLIVNLAAIRAGLQFTLSQRMDEFLDEESRLATLFFDLMGDKPEQLHVRYNRQATSHPRRRLFIQLIDDNSRLTWSSKQSPAANIVFPSDLTSGPVMIGEHRIVCRRVALPGGQELTLLVGCGLGRAQEDMKRFTELLLAIGIALLLIAPLGGYLLAGRATRPIARIIRVTNMMRPAQLEERLPIRGTHDELDRLSRTINNFLDRIAAFVRQSREFTANAAHQLRSPLTALQSSLEIALNADRTTEEYKEVLAVLLEECGQMRFLVNQLLLLAEGDADRLRLHSQDVRLDQLIASSLEMFQVVAEASEVELTTRRLEPAMIRGDGNRLWQVVNNLLDNAIKFTPARGQVSLALSIDGERNECILEVSDTGAGIDPHDLPHIFDRFFQGDKARQRESARRGLGLGLSICQVVIAAHRGTIEAASKLGQGTTFTVRLPDCRHPEPAEGKPIPSSTPLGRNEARSAESA